MRTGIVALPCVDLRRLPDHRSELVSQLLMGEPVAIVGTAARGEWLRLRSLEDGYAGWTRDWGVVGAEPAAWLHRARHRVADLWVAATSAPEGGETVSTLLWRNRAELVARRGERSCLELPDGRRCWVAADQLMPAEARVPLRALVPLLLGIPYLWGGRTVQGFDCSGLVQQLLAAAGVAVPRDAHDQWRACRPVRSPGRLRAGDLLFFGKPGRRMTHVAVALGDGLFVHSMARVRMSHTQPDNPLFDNELMKWYRAAGRPRGGARSGALPGEKWVDKPGGLYLPCRGRIARA